MLKIRGSLTTRGTLIEGRISGVLTHHERWDGTGYPGGVSGVDIPLAGRIAHVADVFDAMTHPHGEPAHDRRGEAIGFIRGESGFAFDPDVVAAFATVAKRDRMF